MYITSIRLKDVRCFDEAIIDLEGQVLGTSVLIAGNNGIGKSAVLRGIVMGLCDRDSAASLLRELEGSFVRRGAKATKGGEKTAEIQIDLKDSEGTRWVITTTVGESEDFIFERVEQHYRISGRKKTLERFARFWDSLFITAYGAGLRTAGTAKYSDYFPPDAVYTLFKYDAPLQDPEISWRRLVAAAQLSSKSTGSATRKVHREVSDLLRYVLNLEDASQIVLAPNGIFIDDGHHRIPLDAMGDGHKALVKVTLDILVWYLLKINADTNQKGEYRNWKSIPIDKSGKPIVRGIVVIDEVEQHLHPKLQREILGRLHDKFPKVQFIVTTHSPLCVSGTADLSPSSAEHYTVFSLGREEDRVVISPMPVPHGLRADQILLDYFELPTTLNTSTEERLKRLDFLLGARKLKRTVRQKREIARLLREMKGYSFSLAEDRQDRTFQKEALQYLAERDSRK